MRTLFFAAFASLGLIATASPAISAPQMMGLVASNAAVPLQCQRGDCFAELTAFCLQPERASPVQGTAYRMHDPSRLVAFATTKDGRRIELDAKQHLEIKAERSHVAVRIGMSSRTMARLGLRQVHIKVARNATLVPLSIQGDKSPLQADEIVAGAGPMRTIGASYVDQEQHWMPVARMTNRLINALPPGGRVSEQRRSGLWDAVIGPDGFAQTPPGTDQRLRGVYEQCQQAVAVGRLPSLRRC
ncbi:MAG: hypothetical protein HN478_10685, partial [Rhodospirillaceae bacterium]|nr:hypothetical protein [Rhodospirillaceae bacterium]